MSGHAESVPRARGCSLTVLNTGPSSEELTGASDYDPACGQWGLSSPTKAIYLSSPLVSLQYTPIELLPASPKGLVLILVRAMVSMAGVQLCGELWGPPESLLGVGETALLPLNSHCCIGLGPEMEGGPAFPTCSQHP